MLHYFKEKNEILGELNIHENQGSEFPSAKIDFVKEMLQSYLICNCQAFCILTT